MQEIKLPQSEAKRRLLDAAEQLLAERGFEAVSVREITRLAKANVAAINYHFGTREGLLALVAARYLAPVNDERLARLENLERKAAGKALPVEEIIDAFVRPMTGIMRKSGLSERLSCRLLGRIFALQGEGLPAELEDQARRSSERFTRALSKALPSVSPEELVWRCHFMVGALIHMLLNQDALQRLTGGAAGSPSMDAMLGRFIRFAAAGLREGVEQQALVKKGPQAMFDF